MAAGRVVQNSAPADLLRHPADPFVTSFIGEDRGLRVLQFTSLAELAGPPPAQARPNGLVLPGTLSILAAGRELGLHGAAAEGFWIGDDAGQPTGYLTYQQFAMVLGETIGAAGAAPGEREAHGLPA